MATTTLCQAEELLRLCARDGGCAMFAMEEDLFDASAMPAKESGQFKLEAGADKQRRQLDTGSHSDNEDDDLLWCPSPTFPTARAAAPPAELHPIATKPELSSSSNSNSSMCTFEAGLVAPDIARASQPTPPIPVPHSAGMEPKRSESVHQGNLFDPQAAQQQQQQQRQQQQELQCSAPPTARAGAAPVAQPFDDGSGSKIIASSTPAGLTFAIPAHLQEASHLEGGGRISPDLHPANQQQQNRHHQQHQQVQELTFHTQQQQQQQAAPAGAAPAVASSVVQHTRHTKRTPIPSVRLQRIMEGDAHATGSHAGARARPAGAHGAAPRKRSGGSSKRSVEQQHAPGLALHSMHDASQQRVKAPRLQHHSGSSASASVSATPEPAFVPGASFGEPNLAPPAFAWPDEGAGLLPDEGGVAWGGFAGLARQGSSSSAVVIPSSMGSESDLLGVPGMPAFDAGMSVSAPAGFSTHGLAGGLGSGIAPTQHGGAVHSSSHTLWLPAAAGGTTHAVPASAAGGGMALMGGSGACSIEDGLLPHDVHVTTDLLDVAAELAAAADKEGSGHGMRGSAAIPTLITTTTPHAHPIAPTPHAQPGALTTTHARLQSLGSQRSRGGAGGQPRSKARSSGKSSAPPPLPRPDYDQHEDSEDGLPQVPPPRHPAGQPRGVPRAPARVLVPHPRGGCCTACKVAATPVWRTGPHGPKTLCNACGVRYTKAVTRKK